MTKIRSFIYYWFILLSSFFSISLFAQDFTIRGKVTDAAHGEGLPFAVVYLSGTTTGTTTDFDGNYTFKVKKLSDSLYATCVGYQTRGKKLKNLPEQVVGLQLKSKDNDLIEVEIKQGENPAWEILRRVMDQKNKLDKRSLNAYEYDSYNKVEIDVDNISQKMRQNKLMKKVMTAIDSLKKLKDDDGKQVLPIFISETISKVYYRGAPYRYKEEIQATQVKGIGVQDGAFVSQVLGNTFLDFNFYKSWIQVANKDFSSPLSDSWKSHYTYDLVDSLYLGEELCYRIDFKPKNSGNLAFQGNMYITKAHYALKQIDCYTDKKTNLNFIEKLKIQQELRPTASGAWLPYKARVIVDLADLSDSTAGLIAKFYISSKNVVENQPRELNFYDNAIEVDEGNTGHDESFWKQHRHDSLTEHDQAVYKMVDTLKNLPAIKTYVEVLDILFNGYKRFGKVDIGPYTQLGTWNNIEGVRMRLGFKTNHFFSNKWILRGFLGFGTKDALVKYGFGADYVISKKKWTVIGVDHSFDLEQLGLFMNYKQPGSALFYTLARFGKLDRRNAFYIHQSSVFASSEFLKGVTGKVTFNFWQMRKALGERNPHKFEYYDYPVDADSTTFSDLNNAELVFELRLAKRETFLTRDNQRLSLGAKHLPILTLRFHQGIKGLMDSRFSYQKVSANLYQKISIGRFGHSIYSITGQYAFQVLPYPLLFIHLGNQTFIYNSVSFGLMNFFEFVSDRSVSLHYQHHFNGYFFNKIPLFKKLKWREVVSFNALQGSISQENFNLYTPDVLNSPQMFHALNPNIPYLEVGYGVENIFKFVRVEFFHRLNYLDQAYVNQNNIQRFGVKLGFQFSL